MREELAQAIKERREALGLAQIKLGPVAGVSHGTIRNAEAGKPLEVETLRKIERALGWLPDSTTPFMSAKSMAILANLTINLMESNEKEGESARALIHAFLQGVTTKDIPRQELDGTRALLARYLPQREVSTVIREAVKGEPLSADEEYEIRVMDWAEERSGGGLVMTSRMETPREVLTPAGRGYVFVVAPLPDDVMEEFGDEEVGWLAETLRKHGIELACGVAATKRRERVSREAQLQREGEGG